MKINMLLAVAGACTLAAGCTATSTTRVVEPAPATTTRVVQPAPVASTQRTVYPDGTYRDSTVVTPATTTTVYR
jgi:PBP1b-binding outer membrane lipoprotein LpoB